MADWLDILQGGTKPDDFVTAAALGQQQGNILRQQQADAAQKQADQSRLNQYRSQVGDLLRSGDYTGASALAYGAGDDKAGAGLSTLQKQHFDQGSSGASAYSNVVASVAALPYEQRKAAIQAAKPTLMAMGLDGSQVDNFDPTNDNIQALGHTGYTYKDQRADEISQQNADSATTTAQTGRMALDKPIVIDHDLVNPTTGQLVYRAQKQEVVGAGSSVYEGDTAAQAGGAGYDTVLGNGKFGTPPAPLSSMTIGNAINFGRNTLIPATRNNAQLGLAGTGMGSSAMGRYQITAQTLARYAPRVLGADWTSQPFDAAAQDRLGEAIFNDAKGGDLSKVWTSLTPAQAAQVAKMPWSQARNVIAGGESGGRAIVTPGRVAYQAPSAADTNAVDVNDPAVQFAARTYAATGEMPPLGNGNGPMRKAILTVAAGISAANHYTPGQIAANKAQLKASQAALGADNKMYDTIQSSEQTAIANGQRYIDLSRNAPGNTSSTVYNSVRNGLGAAFSDTRVTDMNSAYNTFIGEYNRVINSTPSGSGTMSDSSRHEAVSSFSNATSPEAKASAFEVLKKDMAARKQAQQAIIDRRTNLISNIGNPQLRSAAPSNIPAGAISMLRSNPSLRAHFDAKYGAGASASVLSS